MAPVPVVAERNPIVAALWQATTYGFQISSSKEQDEYKLENACCKGLRAAGDAFEFLHPLCPNSN